ncbi:MAG: hypothetical protein KDF60_06690 [Calditrichaeota bacterium]|nr:hypothetical protein [Calditrichota bacterium]
MMNKYLILLFLFPVLLLAQQNEMEDLWQHYDYFAGKWQGHETGKAGIGQGSREYRFIMNRTYLYQENTSRFEPQEKNPKGETHSDHAYFSYDQGRQTFILREFNSEGYVNYYALDSTMSDSQKLVFVSEKSENAPPTLKARLTLEIKNRDEFIETFELSFKDNNYNEWLKNYWTRLK